MSLSHQPETDYYYVPQINPSRTHSDDVRPATAGRGARDPSFRDGELAVSDTDMILSPSPPPQPAQQLQLQSQSPALVMGMTSSNPHVASLKAIFPDFDEAVILSVLESTNNDHDRALDVLLGMNDPSFVPPVPTHPAPTEFQPALSDHAHRLSQEALDEQLARRLALEEEQAASRAWQPQAPQSQTTYQSYQPRRGTRWGSPPQGQPQGQPQGPGGRDTMTDFQEGFNRIAESGKKTFSSIVSKVRAKMQEFEQGQGWSGAPGQSGVPPDQLQDQGSYHVPDGGAYTQPPSSQSQPPGESSPTWTQSRTNTQSFSALASPPRSVMRPSSTAESAQSVGAQQPSYYGPNAPGYDLYGDEDETPITLHDATTTPPPPPPPAAAAPSATQTQTTTRLSMGSPSTPPPASDSASVRSANPPSYKSGISSPNPRLSFSPPNRSLSPTSAGSAVHVPAGTSTTANTGRTGTGGSVDFSKLGLLPKRPISLVVPASGAAGAGVAASRMEPVHSEASTASTADEREEPEYVENPFEDR